MKEKKFKLFTLIFTLVVLIIVSFFNSKLLQHTHVPAFVAYLPLVSASLNTICFILLIFSFIAIKNKNVYWHKRLNIAATLISVLFFINYVIYHFWVQETSYGGAGFLKGLYYFILITHILLSAVVVPLILMSLYYAFSGKIVKHKKWVRWTYPIWLYVTFSGVLVYWMLKPYYNF